MNDSVKAALARAKAAAASSAGAAPAADQASGAAGTDAASTTLATMPNASSALAKPGPKLSMDALMTGAINVDLWVKVKEYGLVVGTVDELIPEFACSIKMVEGEGFAPKFSIKAGNPAQYWSTYDGSMSDKGIPWQEAIGKAAALDGKARPYRSVDVPMIAIEDIITPKKVVAAKAGQKLGYATSTTNWKNWESFYKSVVEAGLLGEEVLVNVTSERLTNKGGNAWGVMVWTLVGPLNEPGADE